MNKSMKSFVLACLLLTGITAISFFGIIQLIKLFPQALPWTKPTEIAKVVLPDDIPLYRGAVLSESEDRGDRLIFKYVMPLGAQTTVRNFYSGEMPKHGWVPLVADANYLEFYKQEGKRRTILRITYENGRAAIAIEVAGNQNRE